ncbi:hypothetical protein M885DRAFT_585342 [Pelagophyceae sp. CCMP2097]|nr:hypothetical protein M885DRAFT_585342 [Pelagophyceae sp. CCMP2097]
MRLLRCIVLAALAAGCAAKGVDVAILLSGGFRGFIAHGGWETWAKHVVDVLDSQHLRAATWLCSPEHEPEVNATVSLRLKVVQVIKWELSGGANRSYAFKSKNLGMKRAQVCHEHLEAWVQAGNKAPRYVIHSRPDARWFADLPKVSTVPPGHVGLRGRTVVWQRGDALFTSDHFSGGDCHVYPDRCAAAIELVRSNAQAKCVNVDDQFAIMPFNLAPTFFGRRPPLFGAVHFTNSSHAFLASNWMLSACSPSCVRGFREGELTVNLATHDTPVYIMPLRFILTGPGSRTTKDEPGNRTEVDCANFTE